MSSLQSGSRRHSARLQPKNDAVAAPTETAPSNKKNTATPTSKKRKTELQEEDDGFVFTRAKKKQKQVVESRAPALSTISETTKQSKRSAEPLQSESNADAESTKKDGGSPKKKPRRLSFSTPAKEPVRRSKRISTASIAEQGSPIAKVPQELRPTKTRKEKTEKPRPPAKKSEELTPPPSEERDAPILQQTERPITGSKIPRKAAEPEPEPDPQPETEPEAIEQNGETYSPTKIALPFADTPVISRNKAMRENKGGKSERRSSLGLRGRRASSLIDSGASSGTFAILCECRRD